jgi:ferredoxin-NADP reductase/MOSC domain-containing protein YiiM/ferredoxin
MATLVSVNVGLPKDISWQGQVVYTSVWKAPVTGRVMARRLNIDGDGQGDLQGHGGEHRAVMVYQVESYRHWEAFLGRPPMAWGSFGENLTVDGLADCDVFIGDRFRMGGALLEVTQPRVTCYRVGLRLEEPRMPSLLVSHKRPGFYCRVIEEGFVGTGDVITKELSGSDVSVAEIDALLYLTDHPRDALERAIRVPALSKGWRESLASMLAAGPRAPGNAGLTGLPNAEPAWSGFRDVTVRTILSESASVKSFVLEAADGPALPPARGGQFIVVRLTRSPPQLPLIRSYSLSDASTPGRYRFSVKRAAGEGSQYLHGHIKEGDRLSISAPRGSFVLGPDHHALVFWSAGIGITPVLAMLRELAGDPATYAKKIYWIHGSRSGEENAFATEVDGLLRQLGPAIRLIAFSQPCAADGLGRDYDVRGRITLATLERLDIPRDAHVYLCGPMAFMEQARTSLHAAGFPDANVFSELFAGVEALRPGIVPTAPRAPHPPDNASTEGAVVTFVRSGLSAHWNSRYTSLLELAEACDVPVRWSCRSGVCHNCETAMIDGTVAYFTEPLQSPATGRILICCAAPSGDIELDL